MAAATSGNLDKRLVHHFVEGQLDWSQKLEFPGVRAIDVSDRGEVAVMAVAEDDTHWIALYDAKGELAWKAQVQPAEQSSGIRFSPSGDALVVRERDSSACSRSSARRRSWTAGLPKQAASIARCETMI